MFAPGYGMPPHGYPAHFPPYTTTPLNSPPLGMHGLWDYNTPAPTPQPQASPFSSSGRSSQRRRRSEQISRDGVPSFPSTPQPNRNSATPGAYPPFYNTPSPRPAYAPVPSPAPGQGEFFYPMGHGGPVPPATPGFSPHAYPAEFEPVSASSSSRPRPSPRPSPRLDTSRAFPSPRLAAENFRAQRLYRKHSHINSDYGGDDDEESILNCPYCHPELSTSAPVSSSSSPLSSNTPPLQPSSFTSVPFESVSPNVEFKFNVEQFNDETYDSEGIDADIRNNRSSRQAHHAPSRDKTRSRNSRTRTPGSTGDVQSPGSLDEIRRPTPPTKEEAAAAGIPQGYATKNWDPQERPIMLLGSVFDANSLGKWIYDWTVYRHGTQSPTTEMAGELWLLLIQLSGKSKRARECIENHRIKRPEKETLVSEFLESGDRLWDRMKRLLKRCEDYMWVGAQAGSGAVDPNARKGSPGVTMGKQSGKEFVDAMFSRDRELERTEKLMTGMRLWSMRFDANCEEILRRPHA